MPYLIAISAIVLVLVFPFSVNIKSYADTLATFALQNIKVGVFPSLNFAFEVSENGVILRGNFLKTKNIGKEDLQKPIKIDLNELKRIKIIRVKSLSVTGIFGAENAMTACMGMAVIQMFVQHISMFLGPEASYIRFQPAFDEAKFNADVSVSVQLSLASLIYAVSGLLKYKHA
jgi:hypothetical protein